MCVYVLPPFTIHPLPLKPPTALPPLLKTLCGRPFVEQENTGNTQKGAKKATKKDVFSLESVYDLLNEHPVGDFLHRVVSFINRVEDAVLPIPVALRATYSGGVGGSSAGAVAVAGRRTLSQMRQADWTDEEAEQQGPYQASRARSSDRGSTSTSRQSISPLVSERNERGANEVVQVKGLCVLYLCAYVPMAPMTYASTHAINF
jgi:hypothetical protein